MNNNAIAISVGRLLPALIFLGIFGLLILGSPLARSQSAVDPKSLPSAAVVKHGWAANGDLILGVKVKAGGKNLSLGSYGGPGSTQSGPTKAFSMSASWLIDGYTQQTLSPRSTLPDEPFFGTMSGILNLKPGDAITFGVAFPHPSDPPRAENGNPLDYKFTLFIPDVLPIEFTIPQKKPSP